MVELFSSVPYILDNTPFISFNFIHVIKSTVYVILVRILIDLFFSHRPYKNITVYQRNRSKQKSFLQCQKRICAKSHIRSKFF